MTNTFNELNLNPELEQAVADLGYKKPTPIQSAVIPVMLCGLDVIGQAQTGTGKTAAFALPMLQDIHRGKVQGLVLTPTRELAIQVAKSIHDYGRNTEARVLAIYGGQPYGVQIRGLKRGVEIVVGTPGRILDLLKRGALELNEVRTLVLDEADEMLSMGFIEDIEAILEKTPANRQTALFSATMSREVRFLAKRYLNTPQFLLIKNKQLTVAAIEQHYYLVNERDKLAALTRLFEVEEISCALIFVRTRAGSGELANELAKRGFLAEALNGDLNQDARERVMKRFRGQQIKVLVATDVAARGLDVDDISHVFNYDLPDDPEVYVHRVGRTGRAGKTGRAISIITPEGHRRLRTIEAYARQKITRKSLPSIEDIFKHREESLLKKVDVWLKRGSYQREREIVAELVKDGNDPLEIAAAALKVARAKEKRRPISEISEVHEYRERKANRSGKKSFQRNGRSQRFDRTQGNISHEEGMVRMMLSRGKAHGVRPNEVVSTIAYHADIPGSTIGKITVNTQHTLVDIPEKYAAQVMAQASNYRLRKQLVKVKLS